MDTDDDDDDVTTLLSLFFSLSRTLSAPLDLSITRTIVERCMGMRNSFHAFIDGILIIQEATEMRRTSTINRTNKHVRRQNRHAK